VTITIRHATCADADAIAAIYAFYVKNDLATFDEDAPDASYFQARLNDAVHPWLIAEEGDALLGYCYAGPYRPRAAYRHTVETSIYLAPDARGKGLGKRLMIALMDELKQDPTPIKQLLAAIAIADHDPAIGAGSVALHESLGFKKVGLLSNTGYKFGQWLHVAFYQMSI